MGRRRADGASTGASRAAPRGSERRDLLLPVLHALQAGVGWISEGGLNYVCERLQVPPAEAYGVATFYAMFSVDRATADGASTSATTSRAA